MAASMMIVFHLLFLVLAAVLAVRGAQVAPVASPIESAAAQRTADLTKLINETLSINNKTLAGGSALKQDDWSFERVEYDLMEFLQDLGARYQADKKSELNDNSDEQLEGRKKTATTAQQPKLETLTASIATTTEISTSLASDDHDIAESKWQYGIFDRFTRARASSTTARPTKDPFDEVSALSPAQLDVRQFNADECGLRTYSMDDGGDQMNAKFAPNGQESPELGQASKDLNQRRQRPNLEALFGQQKKYPVQPDSPAVELPQESSVVKNWANKLEKDAYDSFSKQQQQQSKGDMLPSLLDRVPDLSEQSGQQPGGNNVNSPGDSEFNLASRRHWLQQQLGNTLQLLGFNGSAQSVAEFLNQTSGLSLNSRENMMKKSAQNKLGKSLHSADPAATAAAASDNGSSLSARQDELKLEARVIGGSDARLGDSPWSVSLQALVSRPGTSGVEYRHYCGGTIISEYYVLTAAHCLDFMVGRESRLFVVIGDLNWRMSSISVYGRRFGIDKLIIHSGYKSTAFGHDIGLIRTKESMKPLKSNGRYIVNSVCLPEKGVEHSGEAELVGWGLFSNRNEMADSLQIADVPILPRPLCVDLYKRRTGLIQWLIGIELITDKQICAGTFGRGICQGDSGSALVFNQKVNLVKNVATSRTKRNDNDHDQLSSITHITHQIQHSLAAGSLGGESDVQLAEKQQAQEGIVGKGMLRGYEHREQLQSRATIIGIVAFGGIRRCSYQSLPGVYMQTSKYMDWILPRIQA